MSGLANLQALWEKRDGIDEREGRAAFRRYSRVMRGFSNFYDVPLCDVVSAFVALSPNNDYHGNLRSLASVLDGLAGGVDPKRITVSTYNACRDRAISYLTGKVDFLKTVKGPKIRAFRDNILRPNTSELVTVDGHMVAAFLDEEITMKEAAYRLSKTRNYDEIADAICALAARHDLRPCEMQAVLWMTRKRLLSINVIHQPTLFDDRTDLWRTACDPALVEPFPLKELECTA